MSLEFSRRYAITTGFYPTALDKRSGPTWRDKRQKNPQGLLQVAGVDWDGRPNFNAKYPIRGSQVWYQHGNLQAAEQSFTDQVNSESNTLLRLAKGAVMTSATGNPLLGRAMFDRRFKNPLKAEDSPVSQTFAGLFEEYRKKASHYTKQYQRELVSGLNDISLDDLKVSKTTAQKMIQVRQQAHRSRAAFEEQMSPEEGPDAIGATQPMDAYIKIGNKITGVDVTQELGISSSEQSRSHHHSMTNGALMKEADYLKASDKDIRKEMKNYYQTEIKDRWNPSIQAIRKAAQETTGKKQVTAEDMRNPTGGLHVGASGKRDSPSLPVKQGLKFARSLSGEMSEEQRRAIISHLFHFIGNFSANAAGAYDSFALQHKPVLRTASIFLRNYAASNRSRAFEFKRVRLKDAQVHDGPALYHIGRMHGYFSNRTQQQFLEDATATQLASQGFGSRGTKAVINGSNLAVNGRGRPKVSMDMFIPSLDKKDVQSILHNISKDVTDSAAQAFHDKTQTRLKGSAPSMFNSYLRRYGNQLAEQLGAPPPNYQFWASPFYGTEFVGDTRKSASK